MAQYTGSFVRGLCKNHDMAIPAPRSDIQSEEEFIEELDRLAKVTTHLLIPSSGLY